MWGSNVWIWHVWGKVNWERERVVAFYLSLVYMRGGARAPFLIII